ncbi:MAG: hypothetical protein R3F37_11030 [Candidatus Competibacteraceae bacterium]
MVLNRNEDEEMLARLLLKGLAVEVLLYGIGGWLLWRYAEWSPGLLFLLVIGTLLGIRLLAVGILCAIGWITGLSGPLTGASALGNPCGYSAPNGWRCWRFI